MEEDPFFYVDFASAKTEKCIVPKLRPPAISMKSLSEFLGGKERGKQPDREPEELSALFSSKSPFHFDQPDSPSSLSTTTLPPLSNVSVPLLSVLLTLVTPIHPSRHRQRVAFKLEPRSEDGAAESRAGYLLESFQPLELLSPPLLSSSSSSQ